MIRNLDEVQAFFAWRNGEGFRNAIEAMNIADVDYRLWSDDAIYDWHKKMLSSVKDAEDKAEALPTAMEQAFPNGFTSWHEAHYDVVSFIAHAHSAERWAYEEELKTVIYRRHEEFGTGGMYELALEWTNLFEGKYVGIEWGLELEYYDVIDKFLEEQNAIKG